VPLPRTAFETPFSVGHTLRIREGMGEVKFLCKYAGYKNKILNE
jgi:hypothetical protein